MGSGATASASAEASTKGSAPGATEPRQLSSKSLLESKGEAILAAALPDAKQASNIDAETACGIRRQPGGQSGGASDGIRDGNIRMGTQNRCDVSIPVHSPWQVARP